MKIVYLLAEDYSSHPGLKLKIEGQIKRWVDAGCEVYKVFHSSGMIEDPDGIKIYMTKGGWNYEKYGRLGLLLRLSDQYKFAANVLKKIKPDITYSRYLFPSNSVWSLRKYAGKLVIEINSDDEAEYAAKSFITGAFNKMFRGLVLRMADGLVFVTQELALSKAFNSFTNQREVIANGVKCTDFPFNLTPNNLSPQLGFIGSPGQSWHGLDKLCILADLLPHCTIHVIGPSEKDCTSLWGRVPSNVVMHGYMGAKDAGEIMSKMDMGISTLALHRNGMAEACPLKVRQYLAQGLPILAASKDTDISSEHIFHLRLPNCENNIVPNAERIIEFVDTAFGNIQMRQIARDFATSHLDINSKEEKRLKFFESIVNTTS